MTTIDIVRATSLTNELQILGVNVGGVLGSLVQLVKYQIFSFFIFSIFLK